MRINKNYSLIFVLLVAFCNSFLFAEKIEIPKKLLDTYHKWDYYTIEEQLGNDEKIIPYGKGALFVPAMTDPIAEQTFLIYKDDNLYLEAKTGEKIILESGTYFIVLGTGNFNQLIRKKVIINELKTTIVKPDWAGLKIKFKNLQNDFLEYNYEIYDYESESSFGVFKSSDEDLGQVTYNHFLKAGYYKVVKAGEEFNTSENFVTVFLFPGMLHKYTIYIDENNNENFISAGIIDEELITKKKFKNFQVWSEVSGNINLNQNYESSTDDKFTIISASALWENKITYDKLKNHIEFNYDMEEGRSFEDSEIKKYSDDIDLKFLYIYRLFPYLGPYYKSGLSFPLFENYQYFSEDKDIVILNESLSDTVKVYNSIDELKTSPGFYPFSFDSSIGFNIQFINSFNLNIFSNVGYGYSETIYQDCLISEGSDTFREISTIKNSGLDVNISSYFRLTKYGTLNLEYSFLYPFEKDKKKKG